MVHEPDALAVTVPFKFTDAMLVFELLHVTDLLVALLGVIFAESEYVSPVNKDSEDGDTDTPVTYTLLSTVALIDDDTLDPSVLVAVIVHVPSPTAVTTPDELTFATEVLDDFHVRVLFAAEAGRTVAVICLVSPMVVNLIDDGDNEIDVTRSTISVLSTLQVFSSTAPSPLK